MLRLVLGLFIILGSGYIGISYSARFKKRVCQLDEMKLILKRLSFSICFTKLPLSEALGKVAENQNGVLERVIYYISAELKNRNFKSMEQIWKNAFEKNSDEIYLNSEDIEIITEFAKSLGKGDAESEKDNINAALERLELKYTEAAKVYADSEKLHRSIGLVIGTFIAIILI